MNVIRFIAMLILLPAITLAQDIVFSKAGNIRFFSTTPLENIEGVTKEATSFLNMQKGDLVFSMLVKSFKFEKALMEEHFNENYMESDKFPKANFKGTITNLKEINFSKDGRYSANISGELTIHGLSNQVVLPAIFTVKDGKLSGASDFKIKPADYGIQIPSIVRGKIAELIDVSVKINYESYKK